MPIDTFTSILDEPSSGSIATIYLPLWLPVSIIRSFSSEIMPQTSPPLRKARIKRTSAITSSFCCSSPCTFCEPIAPVMSISPALLISRLMILPASAISLKSCESSPLAYENCSCFRIIKRSRVVPTATICCSIWYFSLIFVKITRSK